MGLKARKIVIIGAGHVGSQCAQLLAVQGLCSEMVLLDTDRPKAYAHAQDLSDMEPLLPHRVHIYAGGYEDCRDAEVAVFCAGREPRVMEKRADAIEPAIRAADTMVQSLMKSGFEGILFSVSDPCDIVTRYLYERTGLPAERVIGTGTAVDTLRLRRIVSSKLSLDAHSVHAYVLGEHGESQMIPWSAVSLGGHRLFELMRTHPDTYGRLDLTKIASEVRLSARNIIEGKGDILFGISAALVDMIKAVIYDEHRILTASTLLRGQYGQQDIFAGIPVVLGRDGVIEAIEMPLTNGEHAEFVASCEGMRCFFEQQFRHKGGVCV